MKQTVHFAQFHDAFVAIRPDNFSYEGLHILFDYLEQYEDDTGEELELDVIALCCDWAECDADQIINDYFLDHITDNPDLDESDKVCAVIDWLNDQTMVAGSTKDGNIVFCTSF